MSQQNQAAVIRSDSNQIVTLRVESAGDVAEVYLGGDEARWLARNLEYAAGEADKRQERVMTLDLDSQSTPAAGRPS